MQREARVLDVTRCILQKYRRDLSAELPPRAVWQRQFTRATPEILQGDRMFWIDVQPWVGAGYVCRGCGALVIGAASERTAHMQRWGCGRKLASVWPLVNADGKCMACDKPTKSKKYAVPLCESDECIKRYERWVFYGRRTIIEALALIEGASRV